MTVSTKKTVAKSPRRKKTPAEELKEVISDIKFSTKIEPSKPISEEELDKSAEKARNTFKFEHALQQ